MPKITTINVGELEDIAQKILGTDMLKEGVELDLKSLGIKKILGRGNISSAFKIRVDSVSSTAEEKIKEAGGSIVE